MSGHELTSFPISAGQPVNLSTDNVASFVFSNHFQHAPAPPQAPHHTFNGQPIPPQRPILVCASRGISLSWERLRSDSLRIARSLDSIVGNEVPWDGKGGRAPVSRFSQTSVDF